MKIFFIKKKVVNVVAIFLALCTVFGMLCCYTMSVKGDQEYLSSLSVIGSSISLDTGYSGGAKVKYTDDNGEWWQRVSYNGSMDTQVGVHIELSEISSSADNYSVIISIGNDFNQWSDKAGYVLVYGNKGHFELFPSKNAASSLEGFGNEFVSVDREELGDTLSVNLKLVNGDYIFTVNGATYTVPATNPIGMTGTSVMSDVTNVRFGFNISGGINELTGDVDMGQKTAKDTTFVISDISYDYTASQIDTSIIGTAGENFTVANATFDSQMISGSTVQNGVKFTQNITESFVSMVNAYDSTNGIYIDAKAIDVYSEDNKASFDIYLGKDRQNFNSGNFYLIKASKDGAFEIIEHNSKGEIKLVSVKREALSGEFPIFIKKVRTKDYAVIAGGKTYTIYDKDVLLDNVSGKLYFDFGFSNVNSGSSFIISKISDKDYVAEQVLGYWPSSANISLKQSGNNAEVSYNNDVYVSAEYVYTGNSVDISYGMDFEISDINVGKDVKYSLVVAIGNNPKTWYDGDGYLIVYGSDGLFEIASIEKGNEIGKEKPIVTLKREALSSTVKFDIKQVDNDYIISVNGCTYTVGKLSQSTVYASVGLMGEITENTTGKVSWSRNWATAKLGAGAKFCISAIKSEYLAPETPAVKNAEKVNKVTLNDMTFVGDGSKTYDITDFDGIKVKYGSSYQGWERLGTNALYDISKGVHIEVDNISADNNKYSLAISMGNGGYAQWYDSCGYMLFYDTDGNLTLHAMQGIGISIGETLLSLKRESIGNSFTLDIKLDSNNYILRINGKVYTIPANRTVYPLGNSGSLAFAFSLADVQANYNSLPDFKQFENAAFTVKKIGYWPEDISDKDDEITDKKLSPDDVDMIAVGSNMSVYDNAKGIKIAHEASAAGWERLSYKNAFTINKDGYHIVLEDINSKADDYSLALAFGNNLIQWVDKSGYMMLYGKNGDFAIIETGADVNPNLAKAVVNEHRESFGSKLSFDIKYSDDKYTITVNGKEYEFSIPTQNSPVSQPNSLYFSYGVVGGGELNTIDFYSDTFKKNNVVFTITDVGASSGYVPDDEITDKPINPSEVNANAVGEHISLYEAKDGVKIVHGAAAAGWERVGFFDTYSALDKGFHIDIYGITSKSNDYSLAIALGNNLNQWVDASGYMILYSCDGNFSILPTSAETMYSPNDAEAIVNEKREPLNKNVSIDVTYKNGRYTFTINNKSYSFTEKECGNVIEDPETIRLSYGVVGGGKFGSVDFYSDSFKRNYVAFTVKKQVEAEESDDDSGYGKQIKNALDVDMNIVGTGVKIFDENGAIRVLHKKKAAGWERVGYVKSFNTTGNGNRIRITDINSKSDSYSFVVAIGNSLNQWVDKTGIILVYGKDGNFAIVATNPDVTDVNKAKVLISEKREKLGSFLDLDLKLKSDNYIITVNGKDYTVPINNQTVTLPSPKRVYYSFGIVGNGKIGNIDFNSNNFKSSEVSFLIKEATDSIDVGKGYNLKVTGYNWKISNGGKGIKVLHEQDGSGWERISTKTPCSALKGGICLDINNIKSADGNYSLAVMLGDVPDPWYDTCGYMMIYGADGNFSIIATSSTIINPNNSPVLISEQREKLGDKLSMNVKLVNEQYIITVNGKEYNVPSKHVKYPLSDVENLYVSIGELNNAVVGDLLYNTAFKKNPLSFTLASITHSENGGEDIIIVDEEPDDIIDNPVINKNDKEDNIEKKSNIALYIGIGVIALAVVTIIVVMFIKRKGVKGEKV